MATDGEQQQQAAEEVVSVEMPAPEGWTKKVVARDSAETGIHGALVGVLELDLSWELVTRGLSASSVHAPHWCGCSQVAYLPLRVAVVAELRPVSGACSDNS
ncbi:hypothetical protein HU200_060979 [Digitaria exilis]|uniref:Uncharacterized protein n=1 Tax=Digitaria exilis TaxID=1010633 RepID=A0A835AI68_9POAL|nr:hypothetical protein HU200_060979 [Digitaria exilis]